MHQELGNQDTRFSNLLIYIILLSEEIFGITFEFYVTEETVLRKT